MPYIELNIVSLAILAIILINVKRRREQLNPGAGLFMAVVYIQVAILVLDILMRLLGGRPGAAARWAAYAVIALYYVLNPAISLVWYLYVEVQVHGSRRRFKKILPLIFLPATANLMLVVVSLFNGALFYFDANNVYHRGRLFAVMAAIALLYVFFAVVLTIRKRKLIPRHNFLPLLLFMLPPAAGGVIQTLIPGVSLIWPGVVISTLIIFINTQNHQLHTDHLTGLYNRRQLDKYLAQKAHSGVESGLLAGMMIDIDSFKNINDRFGHSAGDQALIDTSEILRKTFRGNDFIARFGGDEFVVVMAIREKADLQKAIDRLHENVAQYNAHTDAPYKLSLSIGYDCYFDSPGRDVKEFIRHIDQLMYQSKHTDSDPQAQDKA